MRLRTTCACFGPGHQKKTQPLSHCALSRDRVPPPVYPLGHRSARLTMSLSCNITRALLPLDGVFEEKYMAVCASSKSVHPIWRRHLTPRPGYQQQHPALFNKTLHCSTRLFRRSYFVASNLPPVSNYSIYSMRRRHSGLGSVRSQNIICMPAILPAEDAQQHDELLLSFAGIRFSVVPTPGDGHDLTELTPTNARKADVSRCSEPRTSGA
jgi:hypothetical protein